MVQSLRLLGVLIHLWPIEHWYLIIRCLIKWWQFQSFTLVKYFPQLVTAQLNLYLHLAFWGSLWTAKVNLATPPLVIFRNLAGVWISFACLEVLHIWKICFSMERDMGGEVGCISDTVCSVALAISLLVTQYTDMVTVFNVNPVPSITLYLANFVVVVPVNMFSLSDFQCLHILYAWLIFLLLCLSIRSHCLS